MKIKKTLGVFLSGLFLSSSLMASQVSCVDTVRYSILKELRKKECDCSTHKMLHISPNATKQHLSLLDTYVVDAVSINKTSEARTYYSYLVVTKPGPLGSCSIEYVGLGSIK